MLNYIKTVLEKVSFDKTLFEKELLKGIKVLLPSEIKELQLWCYEKFGQIYYKLLNAVFEKMTLA